MTLKETYIRLYSFSVTEYQDCLLVGFGSEKVDFIIKEVHNVEPLKQNEIESLFAELSNVGEQCDCTELRILAYGGWAIDSKTLSHNPYQYQGKTIYSTEYLHSLLSGRHIELFAHNEYAITKVKEGFQHSRIGAVVQATGTGKSFILSRIISELPLSKKILIIAPSVVIFEEIKKALRLEYGNVDFITFQGLAFDHSTSHKYDYILIDEFHHSESDVWGNAIANLLALNEDAYILGTSATPLRPSDKINVVETVFEGHLFHEFNLSDAITFGVLAQPKVVQSIYNLNEIVETYSAKLKKHYNAMSRSRRELIEARIHSMRTDFEPIQVSTIIKKHIPSSVSHLFVFCSNIEELRKMKKEVVLWFNEAGFNEIETFTVHSEYSNKKNLATIKNFQKDRPQLSLLFSIDMLSEGLHVRNVDGAIFLRKTSSYIVCLQQLGRTLKAGGKKEPIILDLVNNITNAISYQTVMGTAQFPNDQQLAPGKNSDAIMKLIVNDQIIENVAEYIHNIESLWNLNDISWEKKFEELVDYLSIHDGKFPPKSRGSLGAWVAAQRISFSNGVISQERIDKLNSIGFDWGRRKADLDNDWNLNYESLTTYFNENKGSYPKQHTKLSSWVNFQRTSFREGKLSPERIEKLNSIGFKWASQQSKMWDNQFELLAQSLKDTENKQSYNKKLDLWINTQKVEFNKGKLSQERIDKLNSIGFKWKIELAEKWNAKFERLCQLLKEKQKFYNENSIMSWAHNQRVALKKGQLSQEQIDKLNSIGFYWGTDMNEMWNSKFELLCNTLQSNKVISHNIPLRTWVQYQRTLFKRGKLSQERIDKLNSIGFDWVQK